MHHSVIEARDREKILTSSTSCPFCKCVKTRPLLHYHIKSHLDKAVLHKDFYIQTSRRFSGCKGWLHEDCAGKCSQDEPFDCGCTYVKEHPSIIEAVETGGILSVFSQDQIKTLYQDLMDGRVRSNRKYLWMNPSTSWKLKQQLKPRMLHFSDERFLELLRTIEQCTDVGQKIRNGDNAMLDFAFDVFVPEIIIKILEGEQLTRYLEEKILASGTKF